ncbi:MAG: xanthine dehydrogenase accessory protein XdhC [Rhizobiaceae bacterium]|nr:xanthine dehydrogenase accessory protein XdhC [Rhizobiaceae bacterium]
MAELTVKNIDEALTGNEEFFLVEVLETKGSTPRDAGALMMVGTDEIHGTIGGGSAEWVAVRTVRGFIDGEKFINQQTITLGPEIDQCCGGVIEVSYKPLTGEMRAGLVQMLGEQTQTSILIFGAGHTGLALANALAPLNFNTQIIDSRIEYETKFPDVKLRCLALPEEAVRGAASGSVFVVTTHDHSLDFLITAEALARGDAKYVGMIGSPTKRAVLKSWLRDNGYDAASIEKLYCPIGGTGVRNKQPEIIAAMTTAEILAALESI